MEINQITILKHALLASQSDLSLLSKNWDFQMELGVDVIIWFTIIISWENTLAVKLNRAQNRKNSKQP